MWLWGFRGLRFGFGFQKKFFFTKYKGDKMIKIELLKTQRCSKGLIRLKQIINNSGIRYYEVLQYANNGTLTWEKFYSYQEAFDYFYSIVSKKSKPKCFTFFNII